MTSQVILVSLEELVSSNHIYRKFINIWDFSFIEEQMKKIESDNNYKGYGALKLLNVYFCNF